MILGTLQSCKAVEKRFNYRHLLPPCISLIFFGTCAVDGAIWQTTKISNILRHCIFTFKLLFGNLSKFTETNNFKPFNCDVISTNHVQYSPWERRMRKPPNETKMKYGSSEFDVSKKIDRNFTKDHHTESKIRQVGQFNFTKNRGTMVLPYIAIRVQKVRLCWVFIKRLNSS